MDHAPLTQIGPGLHRNWSTSLGGPRLRVLPWQGDPYRALIGPARRARAPLAHDIVHCLETLTTRGVASAVTPALGKQDAQPFLDAGFTVREHLHLLAYDLTNPPPEVSRRLRAGRAWHRRAVLKIDQRAFEPFWQFDKSSLIEARRATPASRFRVAMEAGEPIGYAVTGRAGDRGYLQRLAVAPDRQSAGLGTDLVHDCLNWLHRREAKVAMVNTQQTNTRALGLYEHLGFAPQPDGLVVLQWQAR